MMDILSIAAKGASKTRIMLKANLSFSQLNEYMSFLLKN
jgi:predicted transcriptional regulator